MRTWIILFLIAQSAYAEKAFFSSKIIGSNFITLIINKNRAILRVLDSGFTTATIDHGFNGKSYVTPPPVLDVANLESDYSYYIPEDKCYYLQNFYKVCTKRGKVVYLINKSSDSIEQDDFFFSEDNEECNLFKFEIAYQLFALQNNLPNKQYQLINDGYPDFIKLVVIDYKHLFSKQKINDFSSNSDLRAFFVSSNNDIGCVPYKNLKLYSDGDAQMYKMHVNPYNLVGQTTVDEKTDKPFLIIDKSKIISYSKDLFKKAN